MLKKEYIKTRIINNRTISKVVQTEHDMSDIVGDVIKETHISFRPKSLAGKKFKHFLKKIALWMQKRAKYIFILLLLILVSSLSYIKIAELYNKLDSVAVLENTIDDLKAQKEEDLLEINGLKDRLSWKSFVIVTKQTLLDDMASRFSNISPKIAELIVDTVIAEAKKYGMNPVILYAVGCVESDHRFWIEHEKVTITVDDKDGKSSKKLTVRAVGWGGVVWEHHKEMLIAKGIAKNRADLFYPDVNIRAAAAIYDMFYQLDKKPGVVNQDVSAQRRYFGGNYASYSDKISNEVSRIVKSEIYRKDIGAPIKKAPIANKQ